MSLSLPPLYHWSPAEKRANIKKRGLRPTTPTDKFVASPIPAEELEIAKAEAEGRKVDVGHVLIYHDTDESYEGTVLAVCLGTSPSHAWSLCGGIWADRGSTWDLWQVILDSLDAVHPLPFFGFRLGEFRVANRIPKSRVWFVGSRVVPMRGPR